MLLDDNNILMDNCSIITSQTGDATPLTHLLRPGRAEPVCIFIRATEKAAGGTSVALTLEQADKADGTFATAATATVALADLVPGKILGWRWLPKDVTKPWIRLKATPTGTFTAGKIFAAIVREDPQEYEDGMYIDKGFLQC